MPKFEIMVDNISQNKDTIFINVPVTKEEAYEKTVYHWSIIVLRNYFGRGTDGVCLANI